MANESTEAHREYLDAALRRIDERLRHELIMARVPAVHAQNEQNKALVALLHRCACVFQKHQLTLIVGEDGRTVDGYDADQAAEECRQAMGAIRELALRYQ